MPRSCSFFTVNLISKLNILGHLSLDSPIYTIEVLIQFVISIFAQKHPYFELLENEAIRHTQTAIRHMWRVANGLDNAGLYAYILTFIHLPE